MDGTEVPVESVRDVGPETVALRLSTPANFDPLPGQFVLLRAEVDGEMISRHYTLSSAGAGETFELTVGVDPDGDLSPWLAALAGGESVWIEGPFGRVTYERDTDVLAIAGGPGVGPAVAIAETANEAGHDAAVVYQDDRPAHLDRLESLESDGVDVAIVDGDDDAALAEAIERWADVGVQYVFGFESFVERVRSALADAGVDPEDALIESFG